MKTATIAPSHGILFVHDPVEKNVEVPTYIDGRLTAATDTCISVGTQAEVDGDVEVFLGSDEALAAEMVQVFEGAIKTPNRRVAIVTSELSIVLECEVQTTNTRVRLWVDDQRWPSKVVVEIQ